jgi:hypothetical protein
MKKFHALRSTLASIHAWRTLLLMAERRGQASHPEIRGFRDHVWSFLLSSLGAVLMTGVVGVSGILFATEGSPRTPFQLAGVWMSMASLVCFAASLTLRALMAWRKIKHQETDVVALLALPPGVLDDIRLGRTLRATLPVGVPPLPRRRL